jgi:Spy/CpxP family protein refolding chaperone
VTAALTAWPLFVLLAAAPPQSPEREGPAQGDLRPREEAFKIIDAYIVSNLQESLGLTDDQFVKVLPLVKRLQTDRREMFQRRQRAVRELRRALRSGTATEAQVADLLREMKAVEAEEPARMRKNLDAIDATLTPLQQAKLRVLEEEVAQKIRELMNQFRRQGRPGRPGERPE